MIEILLSLTSHCLPGRQVAGVSASMTEAKRASAVAADDCPWLPPEIRGVLSMPVKHEAQPSAKAVQTVVVRIAAFKAAYLGSRPRLKKMNE